METRTLLVALVLQFSLVALGGAAERCAQPGALRCEEGRHQSVCLERSRVWHRVGDCAASGGFCADGRCVGGVHPRAVRETCDKPSEQKCSETCEAIKLCLTSNVWAEMPCPTGQKCDESTLTCKDKLIAKCGNQMDCSTTVLKMKFPDLTNTSKFYNCEEGGEGENSACEKDKFFNACSGTCDYDVNPSGQYPIPCTSVNTGHSSNFFSNPGLYFICWNGQTLWMQCPDNKGYFDPLHGKCTGESDYSKACIVK